MLTKVLEWGRLMAYLEQSTRYVPYTARPGGRWKYLVPREIDAAPPALRAQYIRAQDEAFETYARWIEPMQAHFRARHPNTAGDAEPVYKGAIRAKAEVLPLGLDLQELERHRPETARDKMSASDGRGGDASAARAKPAAPRRILWNHRWEFDKAPERFFAALNTLVTRGMPFVVDVVGESFARRPEVFDVARAKLGDRVGHIGYIADRATYVRTLSRAARP